MMDVSAWRAEWAPFPVVTTPQPAKMLPKSARDFLAAFGLPSVVTVQARELLELDFRRLTEPLVSLNAQFLAWGNSFNALLDARWANQWIVCDGFFVGGRSAMCVHGTSGAVTRMSVEEDVPDEPVSSSVPQLAQSLLTVRQWSGPASRASASQWSKEVSRLREALRQVDEAAWQQQGFWVAFTRLVDETAAGEYALTSAS